MIKINYKRSLLLLVLGAFIALGYAESYYRDVTAKYMTNPAFLPGWQGALTNVENGVGEVYNGAFDLYQVLYNMPAGNYELTANAFYRCGTNEYAQQNMTDGRNHYASLYLGEASVVVKGLFDGRDIAPNTMNEAAEAFANGEYVNTVVYHHPGGDLVIGIKNLGGFSDEWCAFDNFTLKRGSEDYTHLIVNADFEKGLDLENGINMSDPGWNMLNSNGVKKTPDVNKGGGVYRKTNASPYNFGQRLDLPAGTYRFSVLTFMRYGGAGNYDGKIINCKGEWQLTDLNSYGSSTYSMYSPKQWFDQNLYSDDNVTDNCYLYISMNEEKPLSMYWEEDEDLRGLNQSTDKRVRMKGSWEICNGDYSIMPENETRGTAEGIEVIPQYDVRNVVPMWTDSGMERESAAVFVNDPDKWRQYVEFTLTEPAKVWVGMAKEENSPVQYWNPFADFKLEQLTDGGPVVREFVYEGIAYTVLDSEARTCETRAGWTKTEGTSTIMYTGNSYEGGLVIPDSVSDGSKFYKVIGIGDYGFLSCRTLTSVSLPETLTAIGSYGFDSCTALNSIHLPNSLTKVGDHAFSHCTGLTSIELPESLTAIEDYVFYECSGLSTIDLPETLTSIGNSSFRFCSGLTSLTIPESVTSVGISAFANCSGLTSINIPSTLTILNEHVFHSCSALKRIALPEGVVSIGYNAFSLCSELESVSLPGSLEFLGDEAFRACPELMEITYEVEYPIVSGSYAFDEETYQVATLYMPYTTLVNVMATKPWYQFKHIVAKDGTVPPQVVAGDEFEYNGIYYTVIDPEAGTCQTRPGYTETIEGQGQTIYSGNRQCSGDLIIPETVSDGNQDYTVIGIGECGFCFSRITSITFPSTLTSIGEDVFFSCNDLTYVDWPTTVTYIPQNAFLGCSKLRTISLPETLERIEAGAFNYCESLDSICLPYNLLEAKNWTIANCESLRKIVIKGAQTQLTNTTFFNLPKLVSISLASTFDIYNYPFRECPSIASLEWKGNNRLPKEIVDYFGNPNLLVYVDDLQYAPEGMTNNIVVYEEANNEWECSNLVLTQGYPFYPEHEFAAISSSMTMDFTQTTPIGVSGGWETILLPFDVYHVRAHDNQDDLTSFAQLTDINTQLPYWLYEADSANEWKLANSISAGVPYIIAMPNNPEYDAKYNITGPVTFFGPEGTMISAASTAPYAVTWPSGHQFRSLWLPLTEEEAQQTMGLNVGIDNLTDDDGKVLLPGSAFHAGVTPRPLEGYVTRNGSRMALPVMGGQSHVELLATGNGLGIDAQDGAMWLKSETDRTVSIYRIDGVCVLTVELKAGETVRVADLAKGIYIVAGRKIIMR